MKKLLFITLFVPLMGHADCTVLKLTPMAPDSKGCVGWTWTYTPVSDTNCTPIPAPSNPIARFNPAIDPQDCVFRNVAGRTINLCR